MFKLTQLSAYVRIGTLHADSEIYKIIFDL
jgi:hypothetical protein